MKMERATNGELIDELIGRFDADYETMELALRARGYVLLPFVGDDCK